MKPDAIRKVTLTGLRWLALKSVLGEVVGVTSTVILARLISPAEFGHAAVALLFCLLAVILTFEGFASALVQRPTVDERHLRVAVLMSLVGGTIVGAFVLITAPLVWRSVFGAETARLIALTAPCFVLASIGTVSRATLWRRLDFRRMTQCDLAGLMVGNIVSIVLAVSGLGAVALVVGTMAGITTGSVGMLLSAPEPLPRWDRAAARDIAHFGVHASMAGLVTQLFANIDYWILAARLSAFTTGIYYRAFNLGVVYQGKISNVMMQLAFPVYSRVQDRGEMRRLHERAARVHAVVIFPLLALLFVLAPVLIPFAFGAEWAPAIVPAQILAIAGMFNALLTGYPQVMLAVGRPRDLMRFNCCVLVTYASAIALAASHGLVTVAITVVVVYALILAGAYRFLLRPHLGVSVGRLLPEMGPAVVGCVALVAICWPLRIIMEPVLPRAVTLLLVGCIGLAVYGVVLKALFAPTWGDLKLLIARVIPVGGIVRARRVPMTSTTPAQ